MATESVETDKGLGLTVVFSMVALVGAIGMLAAPTQLSTAWAFAAAVVASILAVVAPHVFA